MYKKVITLWVLICMVLNIMPVFAEGTESNKVINAEYITEDNVIYNVLQNNNGGVSLFSGTSSDEITADFDVVLGFDMSSTMYGFDYNGEMAWKDDFRDLQEQVPNGTRFSVVIDTSGEFTNDLDTAINRLPSNYSGESNIITLLENCLNTFDTLSGERNKVIAAMTANVDDVLMLEEKINELAEYGIAAFVFVTDMDFEGDIENVYSCKTELDLRTAISNLYLSFVEYSAATMSEIERSNNTIYKSDFRKKHKFSETLADGKTGGILLAEILNIYGCVPMKAEVTTKTIDEETLDEVETTLSYDFLDDLPYKENTYDLELLKKFLEADNSTFSTGNEEYLGEFKKTWEKIFEQAQNNKNLNDNVFWVDDTEQINNIVNKNLKRRFPVVAQNGEEYFIISESEYSTAEAVFDTYEYIMHSLIHGVLTDSSELIEENNAMKNKITIKYPSSFIVNTGDKVKITDDSVVVSKNRNSVEFTLSQSQDVIVESLVTYTDGICNIVNANAKYNGKLYADINNSSVWYYDYVYKATNEGIINGYSENNASFFKPEPVVGQADTDKYGKVTRGEFLKIVMSAIGYPVSQSNNPKVWAEEHIIRAKSMGALLVDYSETLDEQYKFDYQEEILSREEAAYILAKVFVLNENTEEDKLPQVPSVLHKYESANYNGNGNKLSSIFEDADAIDEKTIEAVFQMYKNGVIIGYETGNFEPKRYITRAEACKIIIKSLFHLDDVETIIPNVYGADYAGLEIGEVKTKTFDESGKFTFEIVVDREGRFTEYTDGTYASAGYLYQISTKGTNIEYKLTDKNGNTIECVSGESTPKYRLKTGQIVQLEVTGEKNTEFSVIINDCWSDEKKNYIVVYDSYSEYLDDYKVSGNSKDSNSRYRDSESNNYSYNSPDDVNGNLFFETYFEAIGNRNAVFVLAIRDLYFSGQTEMKYDSSKDIYIKGEQAANIIDVMNDTDYSGTDYCAENIELKSHKQKVIEETAQKYIEMINNIEAAVISINKNRIEKINYPEVYIGAPHTESIDIGTYDENAVANKYGEYVKEICSRVMSDASVKNSGIKIVGIYHGKEDPFEMKDSTGKESFSYKIMKASSEKANELGLKLLWIPYATSHSEWENIGQIVNTAKKTDGSPLVDVAMIQPGLFFSNYSANYVEFLDEKQFMLHDSVLKQAFVDVNGNLIGNSTESTDIETTKSKIVFQIEYDISLVTGRNHDKNNSYEENSSPKVLSMNFVDTHNRYKDLIYDDRISFGIYAGGPNEQDYKNEVGENINSYSIINHPSYFSEFVAVLDDKGVSCNYAYMEPKNHQGYNEFFSQIGEDGYYKNSYSNRLIFDITKGLFQRKWSEDIKKYLGTEL